jgi:hypothetical protein
MDNIGRMIQMIMRQDIRMVMRQDIRMVMRQDDSGGNEAG